MAGLQSDDVVDSLAKSIKERSVIKDPTSDAFRKTGTKAAEIIAGAFKEQGVELATNISVLDFGAGSGRVALPLMAAYPAMALTAADVDSESIEYLSHKVSKHCQVLVSGYLPPLDVPGIFET
jgi:predicted RNA methylase